MRVKTQRESSVEGHRARAERANFRYDSVHRPNFGVLFGNIPISDIGERPDEGRILMVIMAMHPFAGFFSKTGADKIGHPPDAPMDVFREIPPKFFGDDFWRIPLE